MPDIPSILASLPAVYRIRFNKFGGDLDPSASFPRYRFSERWCRARQGLTLIELLVAIAITVLLIGVVYLVYGTALNMIRAQTFRRESLEPAAEAMDVLRRDLLCSLAPRGLTNPPFVLIPAAAGEPGDFSLRFFTARSGAGSNDWRAYGIDEVEYALQTNGAPARYALVRQCRPFRIAPAAARGLLAPSRSDVVVPQPGRTGRPAAESRPRATSVFGRPARRAAPDGEILLNSLAGLKIQVYDGQSWTNGWGTGAKAGALPLAARIRLQLDLPSGPRTVASETLIPAGHKIKAPVKTGQPGIKSRSPKTPSSSAKRPVPPE